MLLRIKEKGKDVAVLDASVVKEYGEDEQAGFRVYRITSTTGAVFNFTTKENIVETICDKVNQPYIELDSESFYRYS